MENLREIIIDERGLYDYCIQRGYSPLTDNRFVLPIDLRIEIQYDLFSNNSQFCKWYWDNCGIRHCQECERPLNEYLIDYCSHILSRGSNPIMRYDFRNMNLLCKQHHKQWESEKRTKMRIYNRNQKTIELLKKEYYTKAKLKGK